MRAWRPRHGLDDARPHVGDDGVDGRRQRPAQPRHPARRAAASDRRDLHAPDAHRRRRPDRRAGQSRPDAFARHRTARRHAARGRGSIQKQDRAGADLLPPEGRAAARRLHGLRHYGDDRKPHVRRGAQGGLPLRRARLPGSAVRAAVPAAGLRADDRPDHGHDRRPGAQGEFRGRVQGCRPFLVRTETNFRRRRPTCFRRRPPRNTNRC